MEVFLKENRTMSTLVGWNSLANAGSIEIYLQDNHSNLVELLRLDKIKLVVELLQSLYTFRFVNLTTELNQLLVGKTSQQIRNAIAKLATYQVEDKLVVSARVEYSYGRLDGLKEILGW